MRLYLPGDATEKFRALYRHHRSGRRRKVGAVEMKHGPVDPDLLPYACAPSSKSRSHECGRRCATNGHCTGPASKSSDAKVPTVFPARSQRGNQHHRSYSRSNVRFCAVFPSGLRTCRIKPPRAAPPSPRLAVTHPVIAPQD